MGIQKGSKVTIHYTLKVEDQIVDSSKNTTPLTYTQGQNEIIPGLEDALINMNAGDKTSVTILPEKGYGHHNPAAIHKIPKENFADSDKLKVGSFIRGEAAGQNFEAIVSEIGDTEITIDMNHPLAGKTLNFEVEIMNIEN